jgi:hypothetical protein
MQSKATSVEAYLASLPDDRRAAISAVRQLILDNIDPAFEEGMTYGMIGYYIPHSHYPAGYHCNPKMPLPYAGLASQKGYMSVYLMPCYMGSDLLAWFEKAWAKTGKKLDMGKCCIRFKKLEDLALDVIAEALRRGTAKSYIELYESNLNKDRKPTSASARKATPAAKKAASTPKATKKTAKKTAKKTTKKASKGK